MAALELVSLDTATPQLRAPGTGDTYAAPRAVALTPETLTGSAATSSLSITQTWNTTGTPAALSVAVTDTASNASSLLANFTVGGASVKNIDKAGYHKKSDAAAAVTWPLTKGGGFGDDISFNTYNAGGGWLQFRTGTTTAFQLYTNTAALVAIDYFGITGTANTGADVILRRDAANTLALRNSTNAQAQRTYGTWTDTSNGRWLNISVTTAGVASINATGNGTGASGNVLHISSLPTSNPGPGILWNNAGTPAIGT